MERHPLRSTLIRTTSILIVVATATGLAGCGGDEPRAQARSAPADDGGTTSTSEAPGTGSNVGEAVATSDDHAECAPGPGKEITELDDVVIPAVDVAAFEVDEQQLAGRTIPGFVVPAVRIPERVVDGGCIVEHDAPGGCLGAVEITGIDIPGLEVPGYEIPAVDAGEAQSDAVTIDTVRIDAVHIDGVRQEQVCQTRPAEGEGYVSSVYRGSAYRGSAYRGSAYRGSGYRGSLCIDSACVDAVDVPALDVPAVDVPAAEVDAAELPAYTLEGTDARVIEDEGQTAYLAPADVLFDFDQAELRGDAVQTLQAIAGEIREKFPEATITVEGHTDAVGEPDYNQRLSEDRAEAVGAWLTTDGEIASDRVSTKGYGETLPVAPNAGTDGADNPTGRAQNRRVVITVHT
jgi:outer membrane protein OmpA-like peptidoglycan-associated protein